MIVNSDSGRQSTMKLLGSYPSLQISMAASPALSSLFVRLYKRLHPLWGYCHFYIT